MEEEKYDDMEWIMKRAKENEEFKNKMIELGVLEDSLSN